MKALEKDRNRRYETASAFAADVQRYLHDEPVQACPPSAGYRLQKFARRNKVALATTGLVAVALLVGTAVSIWQALEANRARQLADVQQQRAEQQWQRAEQQRQRAEGNLALARQAVDDMYTEVAEKWLAEQPRMTEVQRQFVEKALNFYQNFAQEAGTERAVQLEAARAYLRVGDIQAKLGAHAKAAVAYCSALHIVEPLATELPAIPEYRRIMALSHLRLGNVLKAIGRRVEAEMAYRAALKLQEQLTANLPSAPLDRVNLAESCHSLALLLHETGRREEAAAVRQSAVKIQEQLVAEFPAVAEYRFNLAQSQNSLGPLLTDLGKRAEAETALRGALKLQQKLSADFPGVPVYRQHLATSQNNLGLLLFVAGRDADAETALHEALKLREQLAAEFPAVPEYRQELAESHSNLGLLLGQAGRYAEAETAYHAALKIDEKLAAEFPALLRHAVALGGSYCNLGHLLRNNGRPQAALDWYAKAIRTLAAVLAKDQPLVTARQFLRNAHWGRAETLVQLGRYAESIRDFDSALEFTEGSDHEELRVQRALALLRSGQTAQAIAEADALTQGKNLQGGTLYDAACVYALAAAGLGDDSQQAQSHAAKAVALLSRAQATGFFQEAARIAHLKQDTDLDVLRPRGDYQRLVQELEKMAHQGGK
jgi:tetratricopeptide (TPR) repeat protein